VSAILFEAAAAYANETADVSARDDLRMAFVAGAEWQWKRVAETGAEVERLREIVDRAQAIISASTYPTWHEAARAALKVQP
jgi:hypothetical protein